MASFTTTFITMLFQLGIIAFYFYVGYICYESGHGIIAAILWVATFFYTLGCCVKHGEVDKGKPKADESNPDIGNKNND